MSVKKRLKEIFMPTVPKIILYVVFVFVLPTFFYTCSNGCAWKVVPFALYKLLLGENMGKLTFVMMALLYFVAYTFSGITISCINTIRKRGAV